jgi:hypothetical protein
LSSDIRDLLATSRSFHTQEDAHLSMLGRGEARLPDLGRNFDGGRQVTLLNPVSGLMTARIRDLLTSEYAHTQVAPDLCMVGSPGVGGSSDGGRGVGTLLNSASGLMASAVKTQQVVDGCKIMKILGAVLMSIGAALAISAIVLAVLSNPVTLAIAIVAASVFAIGLALTIAGVVVEKLHMKSIMADAARFISDVCIFGREAGDLGRTARA